MRRKMLMRLVRLDLSKKLMLSMYSNTTLIVLLQIVHPNFDNCFNIMSYLLAVVMLLGYVVYAPARMTW
jgi:hypothetical protein